MVTSYTGDTCSLTVIMYANQLVACLYLITIPGSTCDVNLHAISGYVDFSKKQIPLPELLYAQVFVQTSVVASNGS